MNSGEHYVAPDQVLERNLKGMKLLNQYYDIPDRLTLIEYIIFTIIGISLITYGTT